MGSVVKDSNKIGRVAELHIQKLLESAGYKVQGKYVKRIRSVGVHPEGKEMPDKGIGKWFDERVYHDEEYLAKEDVPFDADFLVDDRYYIEVKANDVDSKGTSNKLSRPQQRKYPNMDKPLFIALCKVENGKVMSVKWERWDGKRVFSFTKGFMESLPPVVPEIVTLTVDSEKIKNNSVSFHWSLD